MRARPFLLPVALVIAAPISAYSASPENPGAAAPPSRYSPITSGTKSYRPVEPLPWGDVNRRVMPPADRPAATPAPSTAPWGKRDAPAQPGTRHKH